MNTKEKLVASLLTLVIAICGASIGYSCASFSSKPDERELTKIFMCSCGKIFLLHVSGESLEIIQLHKPGEEPKPQEPEMDLDHGVSL